MIVLLSTPSSSVTWFVAWVKEAWQIIGSVIHYAYEARVPSSQSFKNLKPLPKIFIF